ncbi:MAG: isochorismatase [Deinococcus sp.]|nr:isochorismatase [Deinococcus sp.]
MSYTSRLPLFLTVQRHYFETSADEVAVHPLRQRLQEARDQGRPIILVQWDGGLFPQSADTFSRGWVLHPDLRAEEGDLLVRAGSTDPFAGQLPGGDTTLAAHLQTLGCTELDVIALPGAPELEAAQQCAGQYGLTLHPMPLDLAETGAEERSTETAPAR